MDQTNAYLHFLPLVLLCGVHGLIVQALQLSDVLFHMKTKDV